jgi:hypothetical protein
VPLLPSDHPHAQAGRGKVLGERGHNARSSPAPLPSKSRTQRNTTMIGTSKTSNDLTGASPSPTKKSRREDCITKEPKKSKSSTNLTGLFTRMNRSSKDLSALDKQAKDKENTTPPSSSNGSNDDVAATPIWAQYATTARNREVAARPGTREGIGSSIDVREEIKKYTPQDYSPSKQHNFNGSLEQPELRPALSTRPQSAIFGAEMLAAVGRRQNGDQMTLGRKSEDLERQKHNIVRASTDKNTDRKTSGSSAEEPPAKEKLNVNKRGSRVMAAVAVFQSKDKTTQQSLPAKAEPLLNENEVDRAFEAVLESRNIPEPQRQKMRSLTLRVKADFVKQDQEASRHTGSSPPGTATQDFASSPKKTAESSTTEVKVDDEEDSKSTKRSRARSRTFTFSKSDKRSVSSSPNKKQRSQSKTRPISTAAAPTKDRSPTTPTTPRSSFDIRHSGVPAVPVDYIKYLQEHQDVTTLEVGRLHKLRILLRNETVAWVDTFLSLGGMTVMSDLLHRILAIEWREEHEDQLLHEALLCLKGLCTTERAMAELNKVADKLFRALIGVMFNFEAKRGPAEYTTRGVVMTVLFTYLASATGSSRDKLEQRARQILSYLGEQPRHPTERPVDFVLDMRVPRPYKLWAREATNVTKEVFWIFLHQLNIVPLPRPSSAESTASATQDAGVLDNVERSKALEATYTARHFPPSTRAPVPAAPYIGGVEWDATTYLTTHLDLLNGLISSLPTSTARNTLRQELKDSGWEKVMGATLRTCKEKFYSSVHEGLRAWVAAAIEDGWETQGIREGPTMDEQVERIRARSQSPKKGDVKKRDLEAAPKLELQIGKKAEEDDDGWLG